MPNFTHSDRERIISEIEKAPTISMEASAEDWFFLALTIREIKKRIDPSQLYAKPLDAFNCELIEAIAAISPDAAAFLREEKKDV